MTTTKKTRNTYYYLCERGFANQYEILISRGKSDQKYIDALKDWSLVSPNGHFYRVSRKSLTAEELRNAIPVTDFEFAWSVNDSEEQGEKSYFNKMVWENKY